VVHASWRPVYDLPISDTNSKACTLQTPGGGGGLDGNRDEVSDDLLISAVEASEPTCTLLSRIGDCRAQVSGQIASQARERPRFQGTCVTPSIIIIYIIICMP